MDVQVDSYPLPGVPVSLQRYEYIVKEIYRVISHFCYGFIPVAVSSFLYKLNYK
jgi:hypothetical protein